MSKKQNAIQKNRRRRKRGLKPNADARARQMMPKRHVRQVRQICAQGFGSNKMRSQTTPGGLAHGV